jgi:hypothetical protein
VAETPDSMSHRFARQKYKKIYVYILDSTRSLATAFLRVSC